MTPAEFGFFVAVVVLLVVVAFVADYGLERLLDLFVWWDNRRAEKERKK